MKTRILVTRIDASGKKHVREAEIGSGQEYTLSTGGNRFHLFLRDPGLQGECIEIHGEQNAPTQRLRGAGAGVEFRVGREIYRFASAAPAVAPPSEPLLLYLGAALAVHILVFGGLQLLDKPRRTVTIEPGGMDAQRVEQLLQKMGRNRTKTIAPTPTAGMGSPPQASSKTVAAPPPPEQAQAIRSIEKARPKSAPPAIESRRPSTATTARRTTGGGTRRKEKEGWGGLDISGVGGISRAGVIAALTAHLTPLQSCYQAALSRDQSLQGTVTLKWVVSERGNVGAVQVVRSEIANAGLQNCVKGEVRRIRFPRPKGGAVAITFPLVFAPRRF